MYEICNRWERGRQQRQNGPKRHVVWALVGVFFRISFFLTNLLFFWFVRYIKTTCPLQSRHHTLPRSKRESEGCFLPSLPTTPLPPLPHWKHETEMGGNDKIGPKRCQTCRLGLRWVFFFLHVFFILTNVFRYQLCAKSDGNGYGGRRWLKRAQTTHPASFGP